MSVPIEEQIRAVKRELSLRSAVYPRRVNERKMSQDAAEREISAMRGVLETLEEVAKSKSKQPSLL